VVDWIISFMSQYGYLSIFLLIILENVFPPIPSEIILPFSGFMTTYTYLNVAGMVGYATIGSVVGAVILYGLGHLLDVQRLERLVSRFGRYLMLDVSDVKRADKWFKRRGYKAVFFCRMVPLVRSLISIPAGMSGMRFDAFLLYTTGGTLIWNTLLVSVGSLLGESWGKIADYLAVYSHISYIVLGAGAAIALYWLIKK